jgi:hypothetical protein
MDVPTGKRRKRPQQEVNLNDDDVLSEVRKLRAEMGEETEEEGADEHLLEHVVEVQQLGTDKVVENIEELILSLVDQILSEGTCMYVLIQMHS